VLALVEFAAVAAAVPAVGVGDGGGEGGEGGEGGGEGAALRGSSGGACPVPLEEKGSGWG